MKNNLIDRCKHAYLLMFFYFKDPINSLWEAGPVWFEPFDNWTRQLERKTSTQLRLKDPINIFFWMFFFFKTYTKIEVKIQITTKEIK
jgi:hypothetical protein